MAYDGGTVFTLAEAKTAKFVGEMYAKEAIETAKANLVIVPKCNHKYEKDLRMGYKVNIPVMSAVTVAEVTPGTEPTYIDAGGTAVSVTVDKWWVAAVETSDIIELQQSADYFEAAARESGHAIAKKIDTDVAALFSTLASSSVYGSDGQTFTDDIILALMETLDGSDVPEENRCIIGNPSTRVDVFKIDKFVSRDYQKGAPAATGQIGDIYGMPLLITTNTTNYSTGDYGVMMHRDAIGVVIQKNIRARRIPKPWEFTVQFLADAIWGEDVVRTTFGKSFYTRST